MAEESIFVYRGDKNIKTFVLPTGVTAIGDWAFSDCPGLTSVVIPNGIRSICANAFSDCVGFSSRKDYTREKLERINGCIELDKIIRTVVHHAFWFS